MAIIIPLDRDQIAFSSLSDNIASQNPIRFIDAFVEHVELEKLGFVIKSINIEGRPAFDPKTLLKLYLYGYLNGVRSSRKLEKECVCNIEVHWLLGKLTPNYHTIADFRKINHKPLKATFKLYVLFLKDIDLIGGEVAAIDGTKFRASNSKKNNYSPKKLERHLAYIEDKTNEYLRALDDNDIADNDSNSQKAIDIQAKINRLQTNKLKYEALQNQLEKSVEPQVSTTDTDARALLVQGQVVEVSYNLQAGVDQKYKLVVATHTINRNDRNALSRIALETKHNIDAQQLTVLVDKGYHNGREINATQQAGINTIVAVPETVNSNLHGTTPDYIVTKFNYNPVEDTYTCPQNQTLNTTGTWHKKTRERDSYLFKKYRTPSCGACSVKHLCTGRAQGGREIERSQYAEAVEKNAINYRNNAQLYRKRQEINEHIFGTIKRQWNLNYTNLRGLEKVNGEMALIMTVYNIKRSINILGIEDLIAKLKTWKPDYAKASLIYKKRPLYLRLQPFENYKLAIAA